MRRYYPGITIFKLVGCLLVLFSHLMFNRYMGTIANPQLRFLALPLGAIVPCFYAVAGFLAYKGWTNASDSRTYMRRNILRILYMYIPFCLLFMGQYIIPELIHGGLNMGNLILQAKILSAAVVLNGPSVQLWFIPPLLFSMFVCYWLIKRSGMRAALILGILGFLLSLLLTGSLRAVLGTSLNELLSGIPMLDYFKLFIYRYLGLGFPFVLTGIVIAKYEEKFFRARVWPMIMMAAIISTLELIYLLQFTAWSAEYKITIGIIPNTVLLFYWILHVKSQAIQKYHKFINLFSVVTFCGHILLMQLNLFLLNWDVAVLSGQQNVVYVMLTFMECLLVSLLLYKWSSAFALNPLYMYGKRKEGHSDQSI
ncbi:acyltransferase family protein [Paenibacillus alba]|uniref:acyltransferase family protein n=1 Tax=Paenibacillus alba TaxID=1197127 RepID=UPI0015637EDF|nr:acyltransferase family protein [Paenibacillus alba]NQX66769.1 acyltransferase family protein [Paenibacillus alba]